MKQIRSAFFIGFIGIVLIGLFADGVFGHSYVTSPTSRSNQKQSETGCRGPACLGPCDVPKSQARTPVTISRGASVTLQWPRNNHAGGFIRVSWAPTSQSDTMSVFDDNVQQIVCHERGGCKPDDPNDPNGGDSGPADGSVNPCQVTIVVPPYLTDGLWTLQWAWFGGAFALGDYYSCVDYQISGGASGAKPAAFYLGGDYTYPNQQKCKFFNTDRLHQCVNEPCNNPVYPASQEEAGPAFGLSSSSSSSTSSSSGSTPTPSPPVSVTTGRRSITTHAPSPTPSPTPSPPVSVTTGRRSITTGRRSITTGHSSPAPSPTPTPSPNPPPPSPPPPVTSNCADLTTLSTSTATITTVNTWSGTLQAIIELKVRESHLTNWYLQIIWPTSASTTRVQAVYNAGALDCEGTSPYRYAVIQPVGSWAKNLASGTVLTIEVHASNTNLSPSYIQANTQIRVFSG